MMKVVLFLWMAIFLLSTLDYTQGGEVVHTDWNSYPSQSYHYHRTSHGVGPNLHYHYYKHGDDECDECAGFGNDDNWYAEPCPEGFTPDSQGLCKQSVSVHHFIASVMPCRDGYIPDRQGRCRSIVSRRF